MRHDTAPVLCARCDMAAGDEVPLDWIRSVEDGRTRYYCATCARENLRAIEARLDPAWW